jgi:hypothetical protein
MHVNRKPVRVKKPRRLGLTYLVLALFEHCWQFKPNMQLLVGSHREEEVDGTTATSKGGKYVGEWSKLLPKMDFMDIYQPGWLLPNGYVPRIEPYRTRMKRMNPENGSIVWGTSASAAAGHGERGYAMLWDEASRTDNLYDIIGGMQAFSSCRFWVSTIGNLDHSFSTILRDAPGIVQLNPQWWMNPEYTDGLTIDPETGSRSSPWLQRKLAEINSDPVRANELYYADESQQVGGYYSPETYRTMLGTNDRPGTVMPEMRRGEFDIIETENGPQVVRFCDQPNGRWRLWLAFDADGRPSRATRYVAGWDIAAGSTDTMGRGASNSVGAFADWLTGELVAEFVTHGQSPYDVASIACAVGRWFEGDDFREAHMVPERNGPGAEFVEACVKKHGYQNMYVEDGKWAAEGRIGWNKNSRGDSARLAFGLHRQMICDGRFKERSADCVREMRHYQNNSNGQGAPIHTASMMSQDPSGARENHGDRVIARVCICQALQNPYRAAVRYGQAPWGSYRSLCEDRERESFEDQLV